jgi:hypothetical protein
VTAPTQAIIQTTPKKTLSELSNLFEILAKSKEDPQRAGELTKLGAQLAHHLTPDQLVDWISQLDDADGRRALTRGFLTGLTSSDPKAAAQLALTISEALPNSGLTAEHATYSVVQSWATKDPTAAADFLAGIQAGSAKENGMRALAHQWTMADPAAAMAWAMSQEANGKRLLNQIARTYSQRDPEAAIQQLFEMESGPQKDAYLAGIAPAWVGIDPQTAMDAVNTIGDRSQRISAIHQAVVRWAHKDPAAAAAWTAESAEKGLQSALQQNIARAWSSRDPVAALSWAAEQDDLNLRERLVAAAAPQAVWRNPELAIDTVTALPESQNKQYAVERLVSNWAQRDPAAAATFVAENELVAEKRGAAAADVAYQWGRRDSAQTINWLSGLNDDQGRWNAVLGTAAGAAKMQDGRLIGQWRQTMRRKDLDRIAVREWLNREEVPSGIRDELLPLTE